VQAQVILRQVTASAAHLAELLNAGSLDGHASPDGGAIAFGSNQAEQDAVIAIVISVKEQRGRLSDVQQHDVDVPGIKNVAESRAAA